jgi:replication factor C subunit 1
MDITKFFKSVGAKPTAPSVPKVTSKPVATIIADDGDDDIVLVPSHATPIKATASKNPAKRVSKSPKSPEKPTNANPKTPVKSKVDANGFLDSIDDVDGDTFDEAEYKKRKRIETEGEMASPTKATSAAEMSPKTPKKAKLASSTTPGSVSTSPPGKAKKTSTPAKKSGINMAASLSTPEKLHAMKIPTVNPEDVSVIYASYGNFVAREGPPMAGMKEIPTGAADCLKSFVFVVTGVLDSLEREEAADLITRLGGTHSKTLGKRVTHAVVGKNAGPAKINQIRERNIPMIDEDGLFTLIRRLSGEEDPTDGGEDANPTPNEAAGSSNAENGASTSTASDSSTKAVTTPKQPVTTNPSANASKMVKKPTEPVSLTVTLPSPVHPQISTMWTDKYAPKSSNELVGNPRAVSQLKTWLQNWDDCFERAKAAVDDSSKQKAQFPRAALLMGPPGVGKTCSALVIAKECGYHAIHLNASDQRSQSTLKERVAGLLSNRGINEFFSATGTKTSKTVLLMDEIDGMSSGDRGGMAELANMVKSTKIPIIAMANDKQKVRGLAQNKSVLPLAFSAPLSTQTYARIASIAANEGLVSLREDTLRKVVDSCNGDLRMTLNALQLIAANPGALARSTPSGTSGSAVDQHMKSASKDVTLGAFDVVPRIFGVVVASSGRATSRFDDRLDHYFVDYSLVPLFVHQSYIKTKLKGATASLNQNQSLQDIRSLRRAIDSICDADIIGASIFSQQNFGLLPVHGTLSTLRPAAILNSSTTSIEFPSVLSKFSSQRRRKGLLDELESEMYMATGGVNARAIRLDYLPSLTRCLIAPLATHQKAGIETVMSFMENYGISKDGRDSVLDIAELKYDKSQKDTLLVGIETGTKTAFTNTYKAKAHTVKFKRKKAKASGSAGAGDDEIDEDVDPNADETAIDDEEDDNPENDSLVHLAKAKKTKAAAKTVAARAKKVSADGEEPKPKAKRAKSTTAKL